MDKAEAESRLVVDLSFLIFEGILTGGLRGIQRVQMEVAKSLSRREQAVFCVYAFGKFRRLSNMQVKAILSLDYNKRHLLTNALGLTYTENPNSKEQKKAQIAPSVTQKSMAGTLSGYLEPLAFKLGKLAFRDRYDYVTGSPEHLPVFEFNKNDVLLEVGLIKDPNKLANIALLRENGLKFAYVTHDLFHLSHSYLFRASKKYLHRIGATFKLVDQLICDSHYTQNTVNEWSPFLGLPLSVSAQSKVVHLSGRPTSLWQRDDSQSTQIEGPFFLAIGNIEPRKNYEVVFEALKQLDLEALGHRFLIVSRETGYMEDVLSALDDNPKNKPYVKIVSNLDDLQLKSLIEDCSFLIHPALMEGFGLPPLEAMAAGKLPLISNAGAMLEFCQGALVFPSLNADACATAITQACAMSEAEKTAKIADNPFKDRTWDHVADDLVEILINQQPTLSS